MSRQLVDIAYNAIKNNKIYNKKPFTFDDIINEIVKNSNVNLVEVNSQLGVLYTTLIQDTRFISIGDLEWNLRERLSLDEITKINNAMYEVGLYKDSDREEDEHEIVKNDKLTQSKEQEESDEVSSLSDFVGYEDEDEEFKNNNTSNKDEIEDEEELEEEE
ncbi:DNA-directed RNA polymerase subunit delta [Ureaplasma parvum]|uniref:Probable DNA-directed RNA polymerase subunit delta n=3 Tax=Ureaplasma parvum TaxID=134821 RepID=RPOE_UREPA|nr:DNA-directed RNA polymerase subunit delta [Ureaplasma parvum]Q9PPP2.1 RecName: Full=Probable DNA-directed RNA polymerase subunit delta; AltName: Full=RNAP delta factor [Ureaplasma parvum serovar 3 str. ATCC 700970]pir/A82871/ DNA-directed RNA polymerase delta subunit UU597 [imported] - Ureaplasma urealyticum [Ureaplasma urealyticum]AAF31011.1 DNA-directed RNA polymerase delta subunit [Ureaplasma parvum serovar 3 str. ATCC 700970]ACA33210.1 DNA-directed RNA polymerase, delta subunit [Ureaplas